ncbi:MAG: STAS domain-containing protein [candidate division Zixibacteria bacterium]|nr:STAS domain-containing protein [candidate division Zixibacteria bacterium]
MKHGFRSEHGIGIFELHGKLMGESDDLKLINEIEKYAEEGTINIIMDFADVEWTNSRGVGVCISAREILQKKGGDLRLSGLGEKVLSIFKLTYVDTIIKIFDSTEEAILSFNK